MDAHLREKLDSLPTAPGVYLMKDREGNVVYVGKAVNLRARVRSYFQPGTSDTRSFVPLLDRILGDIEVILVDSEKEALLLENTLIKRHKPRFNVRLRDDKSYICLRLDERHPYPRLEVVRRIRQDGARYFGPYSSATAIRETLRIINRYFQLRTCTDAVLERRTRPCLLYQIKRCPAPCVFDVPQEAYRRSVREVILFLEGKEPELVEQLRARMRQASDELRFEDAARLRDQIRAIERSLERQRMVFSEFVDQDVFGYHREGPHLAFEILYIRGGRLVSARSFYFSGQEFPTEELLASFVDQYYEQGAAIPDEILLPLDTEDLETREAHLGERRGKKVRVLVPRRGEKKRLVEMANRNAEQALIEARKKDRNNLELLERLQRKLGLSRLPRRIECFDVSHFQGSLVVASQVAALDGEPDKSRYRHYKIKSFQGQDDFAAIHEVISRRVEKGDLPDLFLIDGGKGQLHAARAALKDAGLLGEVDLAAIAKSRLVGDTGPTGTTEGIPDRIFVPGRKDPIVFPPNAAEFYILQRLRDEAHRFAVTFHQKLRRAVNFRSVLEQIPGVGEKRRKALLRHFGSLRRIRAATVDEICEVEGFSRALAERVVEFLARTRDPDRDSDLPEGAAQSMDPDAVVGEVVEDEATAAAEEAEAGRMAQEVERPAEGLPR